MSHLNPTDPSQSEWSSNAAVAALLRQAGTRGPAGLSSMPGFDSQTVDHISQLLQQQQQYPPSQMMQLMQIQEAAAKMHLNQMSPLMNHMSQWGSMDQLTNRLTRSQLSPDAFDDPTEPTGLVARGSAGTSGFYYGLNTDPSSMFSSGPGSMFAQYNNASSSMGTGPAFPQPISSSSTVSSLVNNSKSSNCGTSQQQQLMSSRGGSIANYLSCLNQQQAQSQSSAMGPSKYGANNDSHHSSPVTSPLNASGVQMVPARCHSNSSSSAAPTPYSVHSNGPMTPVGVGSNGPMTPVNQIGNPPSNQSSTSHAMSPAMPVKQESACNSPYSVGVGTPMMGQANQVVSNQPESSQPSYLRPHSSLSNLAEQSSSKRSPSSPFKMSATTPVGSPYFRVQQKTANSMYQEQFRTQRQSQQYQYHQQPDLQPQPNPFVTDDHGGELFSDDEEDPFQHDDINQVKSSITNDLMVGSNSNPVTPQTPMTPGTSQYAFGDLVQQSNRQSQFNAGQSGAYSSPYHHTPFPSRSGPHATSGNATTPSPATPNSANPASPYTLGTSTPNHRTTFPYGPNSGLFEQSSSTSKPATPSTPASSTSSSRFSLNKSGNSTPHMMLRANSNEEMVFDPKTGMMKPKKKRGRPRKNTLTSLPGSSGPLPPISTLGIVASPGTSLISKQFEDATHNSEIDPYAFPAFGDPPLLSPISGSFSNTPSQPGPSSSLPSLQSHQSFQSSPSTSLHYTPTTPTTGGHLVKRPRGRPRINDPTRPPPKPKPPSRPIPSLATLIPALSGQTPMKRGRGRPKSIKTMIKEAEAQGHIFPPEVLNKLLAEQQAQKKNQVPQNTNMMPPIPQMDYPQYPSMTPRLTSPLSSMGGLANASMMPQAATQPHHQSLLSPMSQEQYFTSEDGFICDEPRASTNQAHYHAPPLPHEHEMNPLAALANMTQPQVSAIQVQSQRMIQEEHDNMLDQMFGNSGEIDHELLGTGYMPSPEVAALPVPPPAMPPELPLSNEIQPPIPPIKINQGMIQQVIPLQPPKRRRNISESSSDTEDDESSFSVSEIESSDDDDDDDNDDDDDDEVVDEDDDSDCSYGRSKKRKYAKKGGNGSKRRRSSKGSSGSSKKAPANTQSASERKTRTRRRKLTYDMTGKPRCTATIMQRTRALALALARKVEEEATEDEVDIQPSPPKPSLPSPPVPELSNSATKALSPKPESSHQAVPEKNQELPKLPKLVLKRNPMPSTSRTVLPDTLAFGTYTIVTLEPTESQMDNSLPDELEISKETTATDKSTLETLKTPEETTTTETLDEQIDHFEETSVVKTPEKLDDQIEECATKAPEKPVTLQDETVAEIPEQLEILEIPTEKIAAKSNEKSEIPQEETIAAIPEQLEILEPPTEKIADKSPEKIDTEKDEPVAETSAKMETPLTEKTPTRKSTRSRSPKKASPVKTPDNVETSKETLSASQRGRSRSPKKAPASKALEKLDILDHSTETVVAMVSVKIETQKDEAAVKTSLVNEEPLIRKSRRTRSPRKASPIKTPEKAVETPKEASSPTKIVEKPKPTTPSPTKFSPKAETPKSECRYSLRRSARLSSTSSHESPVKESPTKLTSPRSTRSKGVDLSVVSSPKAEQPCASSVKTLSDVVVPVEPSVHLKDSLHNVVKQEAKIVPEDNNTVLEDSTAIDESAIVSENNNVVFEDSTVMDESVIVPENNNAVLEDSTVMDKSAIVSENNNVVLEDSTVMDESAVVLENNNAVKDSTVVSESAVVLENNIVLNDSMVMGESDNAPKDVLAETGKVNEEDSGDDSPMADFGTSYLSADSSDTEEEVEHDAELKTQPPSPIPEKAVTVQELSKLESSSEFSKNIQNSEDKHSDVGLSEVSSNVTATFDVNAILESNPLVASALSIETEGKRKTEGQELMEPNEPSKPQLQESVPEVSNLLSLDNSKVAKRFISCSPNLSEDSSDSEDETLPENCPAISLPGSSDDFDATRTEIEKTDLTQIRQLDEEISTQSSHQRDDNETTLSQVDGVMNESGRDDETWKSLLDSNTTHPETQEPTPMLFDSVGFHDNSELFGLSTEPDVVAQEDFVHEDLFDDRLLRTPPPPPVMSAPVMPVNPLRPEHFTIDGKLISETEQSSAIDSIINLEPDVLPEDQLAESEMIDFERLFMPPANEDEIAGEPSEMVSIEEPELVESLMSHSTEPQSLVTEPCSSGADQTIPSLSCLPVTDENPTISLNDPQQSIASPQPPEEAAKSNTSLQISPDSKQKDESDSLETLPETLPSESEPVCNDLVSVTSQSGSSSVLDLTEIASSFEADAQAPLIPIVDPPTSTSELLSTPKEINSALTAFPVAAKSKPKPEMESISSSDLSNLSSSQPQPSGQSASAGDLFRAKRSQPKSALSEPASMMSPPCRAASQSDPMVDTQCPFSQVTPPVPHTSFELTTLPTPAESVEEYPSVAAADLVDSLFSPPSHSLATMPVDSSFMPLGDELPDSPVRPILPTQLEPFEYIPTPDLDSFTQLQPVPPELTEDDLVTTELAAAELTVPAEATVSAAEPEAPLPPTAPATSKPSPASVTAVSPAVTALIPQCITPVLPLASKTTPPPPPPPTPAAAATICQPTLPPSIATATAPASAAQSIPPPSTSTPAASKSKKNYPKKATMKPKKPALVTNSPANTPPHKILPAPPAELVGAVLASGRQMTIRAQVATSQGTVTTNRPLLMTGRPMAIFNQPRQQAILVSPSGQIIPAQPSFQFGQQIMFQPRPSFASNGPINFILPPGQQIGNTYGRPLIIRQQLGPRIIQIPLQPGQTLRPHFAFPNQYVLHQQPQQQLQFVQQPIQQQQQQPEQVSQPAIVESTSTDSEANKSTSTSDVKQSQPKKDILTEAMAVLDFDGLDDFDDDIPCTPATEISAEGVNSVYQQPQQQQIVEGNTTESYNAAAPNDLQLTNDDFDKLFSDSSYVLPEDYDHSELLAQFDSFGETSQSIQPPEVVMDEENSMDESIDDVIAQSQSLQSSLKSAVTKLVSELIEVSAPVDTAKAVTNEQAKLTFSAHSSETGFNKQKTLVHQQSHASTTVPSHSSSDVESEWDVSFSENELVIDEAAFMSPSQFQLSQSAIQLQNNQLKDASMNSKLPPPVTQVNTPILFSNSNSYVPNEENKTQQALSPTVAKLNVNVPNEVSPNSWQSVPPAGSFLLTSPLAEPVDDSDEVPIAIEMESEAFSSVESAVQSILEDCFDIVEMEASFMFPQPEIEDEFSEQPEEEQENDKTDIDTEIEKSNEPIIQALNGAFETNTLENNNNELRTEVDVSLVQNVPENEESYEDCVDFEEFKEPSQVESPSTNTVSELKIKSPCGEVSYKDHNDSKEPSEALELESLLNNIVSDAELATNSERAEPYENDGNSEDFKGVDDINELESSSNNTVSQSEVFDKSDDREESNDSEELDSSSTQNVPEVVSESQCEVKEHVESNKLEMALDQNIPESGISSERKESEDVVKLEPSTSSDTTKTGLTRQLSKSLVMYDLSDDDDDDDDSVSELMSPKQTRSKSTDNLPDSQVEESESRNEPSESTQSPMSHSREYGKVDNVHTESHVDSSGDNVSDSLTTIQANIFSPENGTGEALATKASSLTHEADPVSDTCNDLVHQLITQVVAPSPNQQGPIERTVSFVTFEPKSITDQTTYYSSKKRAYSRRSSLDIFHLANPDLRPHSTASKECMATIVEAGEEAEVRGRKRHHSDFTMNHDTTLHVNYVPNASSCACDRTPRTRSQSLVITKRARGAWSEDKTSSVQHPDISSSVEDKPDNQSEGHDEARCSQYLSCPYRNRQSVSIMLNTEIVVNNSTTDLVIRINNSASEQNDPVVDSTPDHSKQPDDHEHDDDVDDEP